MGRLSAEVVGDDAEFLCDPDEGLLVGRVERVEDDTAYGAQVCGRCQVHDVETGVGEFGEGVTAVGRVGRPYDPATLFTAFDDIGQAGERPAGEERKLSHPQLALRGLGKMAEHEVLEQGEAMFLPQRRLQLAGPAASMRAISPSRIATLPP